MTVARTAARRRRQAVAGFKHMARIGRGNNNRPKFSHHSIETLNRREAAYRERRAMEMLLGRKRKGK